MFVFLLPNLLFLMNCSRKFNFPWENVHRCYDYLKPIHLVSFLIQDEVFGCFRTLPYLNYHFS